MSWLTITWSMCAGICAMLAFLHLMLGFRNRNNMVYWLSALMALSAGVNAMLELSMMHTQSPSEYARLIKWGNVFVFLILIPMVWLVYLRLDSSRRWLALMISAMWGVGLISNFVSPGGLVFQKVDEIKIQSTFWGEQFSVAIGHANPWVWLVNAATLLILIYVTAASIRAWRRGEHHAVVFVGGGIVVFLLIGLIHSILVDNAIIKTPYMVSFAYLAIVLAMSYELVSNAVQAPILSREVLANEQRWQTLLNDVQLAVVEVDPNGMITYYNPFLQKLTGYSEDALSHSSIASFIPADEQAEFNYRLQQAAVSGPRPHSQWSIVCASGEERQLAWSSVRQLDSNGDYVGLLAVGADITEGLKAQRELQRTQHELERLTRASMLGELASGLAHELNQPLAAILSNSQAALRFIDNDKIDIQELQEILEDIVRDDKHASEVIRSLRTMLHKGEIKSEQFDIRQALDEVVTILQHELDAHEIRIDIADDLPQIEAGRIEVQQVLMNLLLNAMRATKTTPAAQRLIRVLGSQRQEMINISVEDSGKGIKPEDFSNIFTAFYSTDSAGMGMGLSICKRIIEAHGGKIWAENSPHGGAMFSFSLPMQPSHG